MQYPRRHSQAHKGQNGKILCIGGNEHYHGAPILSALGAEASGVDLIFLAVPPRHAAVVRQASANFIVYEFQKEHLSPVDVPFLLDFTERMADSFVIGNGLGLESESREALVSFVEQVSVSGVVDAEGLHSDILPFLSKLVITPHDVEFERVFDCLATPENVQKMAQEHQANILKKGVTDYIATPQSWAEQAGGVPEMCVGGTGDALSGVIGGLLAQGQSPREAMRLASYFWKKTGEALAQEKTNFTAAEMCARFPYITYDQ